MRLVGETVGQYVVATHSTEIINDADPGDILLVRPESRSAKRIRFEGDYNEIFTLLGSSENAQFARLARTKRVLYVEGSDRKDYQRLAKAIGSEEVFSDNETTYMRTDGFSNWDRVPSTSWVFNKMFDFNVSVAAIFDRDYRCDDEVISFLESIKSDSIFCRVLPCKEIENLYLNPKAISRATSRLVDKASFPNWEEIASRIIDEEVSRKKQEVFACRVGERTRYVQLANPKFNPTSLAQQENLAFERNWLDPHFRLSVVPGKDVLAAIFGRLKAELNVSMSKAKIAADTHDDDLGDDVKSIFRELREFFLADLA
jgi:hypothetical protein